MPRLGFGPTELLVASPVFESTPTPGPVARRFSSVSLPTWVVTSAE